MKTLTCTLLFFVLGCNDNKVCTQMYDNMCIVVDGNPKNSTVEELKLAYTQVKKIYPDIDYTTLTVVLTDKISKKYVGYYQASSQRIKIFDFPHDIQRQKTMVHEFLHHVGEELSWDEHSQHDHFFFDEHSGRCSLENVLTRAILNVEEPCAHDYF